MLYTIYITYSHSLLCLQNCIWLSFQVAAGWITIIIIHFSFLRAIALTKKKSGLSSHGLGFVSFPLAPRTKSALWNTYVSISQHNWFDLCGIDKKTLLHFINTVHNVIFLRIHKKLWVYKAFRFEAFLRAFQIRIYLHTMTCNNKIKVQNMFSFDFILHLNLNNGIRLLHSSFNLNRSFRIVSSSLANGELKNKCYLWFDRCTSIVSPGSGVKG